MDNGYFQYLNQFDSQTFREFMETYGQDVWNYAYFFTKSIHAADDISQDAFISAYEHISSFRGASPVKHWLLKITRNTAINYRKKAFFRKMVLVDRVSTYESAPSAENEFFNYRYTDDIWNHVMKLPMKNREVLILNIRYDLSMDEIASLLNISTGTVKSRLHRAKVKLSLALKGETTNE